MVVKELIPEIIQRSKRKVIKRNHAPFIILEKEIVEMEQSATSCTMTSLQEKEVEKVKTSPLTKKS